MKGTIAATISSIVVISTVLFIGFYDPKSGVPSSIEVDGKVIEFTHTDNNEGENLIIWTDRANYTEGFSSATVYVAVSNMSGVDQNIELMGYFKDDKRTIKDVAVLKAVTYRIEHPVMQTLCEEIKGSTTPCVDTPTGTTTEIITKNEWRSLGLEERTSADELAEAQLLTAKQVYRKPVDNYISEKATTDYLVPAGGVTYYRLNLQFIGNESDNFFLEAVGDQGAYGHLDPWFNPSWVYRVKIEINPDQVPGSANLTNYPVYIDLNRLPAGFHTNAKSDACDIRVVESDETTETPFELVWYASSTDTGELHFKADSLSFNATTTFYIYYGNSGASCYAVTDTFGRNNVWSDYIGVYHMENTATSSTGSNNGTATAVAFGSSFGKLGQGVDFDSSSDVVSVTDAAAIQPTTITMSAWTRADSLSGFPIFFDRYNGFTADGYRMFFGTNNLRVGIYQGAEVGVNGTTALSTATYYHVAATYDASTLRLFLNGASEGTLSTSGNITYRTTTNLGMGKRNTGSTSELNGQMDEVRLRSGAVSTDWITTEYNNLNSPTTFFWVGAQETDTGGGSSTGTTDVILFD